MKRKLFTLGLSFCVLTSICVPGTLATKAAAQSSLVCEKVEHIHTDACYTVSDVLTCSLETGEGAHTHDADCYAKELSCNLEEHTHSKNCYETAGSNETEQLEVLEPVLPETSVHIEGCSDECDGVDCECECHKQNESQNSEQELSLLERLLACETMGELFAMMDEASDEEWDTLIQDDFNQINNRIANLMSTYTPEPLDPAEMEEEIIPPAVNFTNVAPFGDPVIG